MKMPALRVGTLIAALTMVMAAAAQGASFDCTRAATDNEHVICADPKLSAMDDELARQYAAALAQSLDPAMLRAEQSEWLARVRKLKAPHDVATAYAARLETLGRLRAAPEIAAAKRIVNESDVRPACLATFAEPIDRAPCKVDEFGAIGTVDGDSFSYALYGFRTPKGATMVARALIFERLSGHRLRIHFVPENEGGPFYTPKMIRTSAGVLLHVPGYESGTGNFNRERLFVWRNRHWWDVDVTSWLGTLQSRLPKGFGVWKGVYPDYRNMTATTPLWRDGDGNASPTGGQATIRLALRGDRIVLKSVVVYRADAEPR
jgi:uncharacterized protein